MIHQLELDNAEFSNLVTYRAGTKNEFSNLIGRSLHNKRIKQELEALTGCKRPAIMTRKATNAYNACSIANQKAKQANERKAKENLVIAQQEAAEAKAELEQVKAEAAAAPMMPSQERAATMEETPSEDTFLWMPKPLGYWVAGGGALVLGTGIFFTIRHFVNKGKGK